MTSNNLQCLPHNGRDKREPRFVSRHFSFHRESAAVLSVELKATEFSQSLAMENFERLQRSADLQYGTVPHLHDYWIPLHLGGAKDLVRVHGLPPVQILPRAERLTSNNVPAYLLILEVAA